MVLAPAPPPLPVSHSEMLWAKIRLAEPRLQAAGYRFWTHPELRELYPRFLVQLFHLVRGGLELMRFAAAQAATMPHCSVARIASGYLLHHAEEEQDHADWLLRDLAALGVGEAAVHGAVVLPAVRSLLNNQYQAITSTHPVSLFGYLLVLEGSPPLPDQLDAIEARTGLPRPAFDCLRAHGEDDPAHFAELNSTLDSMPLTLGQETGIALSAFAAVDGASSFLDALPDTLPARPPALQAPRKAPEASRHA